MTRLTLFISLCFAVASASESKLPPELNDNAFYPRANEREPSLDRAISQASESAAHAIQARDALPTYQGLQDPEALFRTLSSGGKTVPIFIYGELLDSDIRQSLLTHSRNSFVHKAIVFGARSLYNRDCLVGNTPPNRGFANLISTSDGEDAAPGLIINIGLEDFVALASELQGFDLVPMVYLTWQQLLEEEGGSAPLFHTVYTFSAPYGLRGGRYLVRDDLSPDPEAYGTTKAAAAQLGTDFLYQWMRSTYLADGRLPVDSWDRFHVLPLSTLEGQALLKSSLINRDFWSLSQHFQTQSTNALCAVASSVMILNALPHKIGPKVSQYASYRYFTQEAFFTERVLELIDPKDVAIRGMKLYELSRILERAFDLKVKMYLGSITSIEEMRNEMIEILEEPHAYVIANYLRPALGQKRAGHFSPIAAYSEERDAFLILDVSRYKYPPIWVPTERLWESINSCDGDCSHGRGFLKVGY